MYDERVIEIIGEQFREGGKCMIHGEYDKGNVSNFVCGDGIATILLLYHIEKKYCEETGFKLEELHELLMDRERLDHKFNSL